MLENTKRLIKSTNLKMIKTQLFIIVSIFLMIITGCSSPTTPGMENSYSIIYHANGADSGTVPDIQQKEAGSIIELSENSGNLVKSDYLFLKWNTAPDGTGTDYECGDTYSDDADLNLYAKWRDRAFVTKWLGGSDKTITIPTNSNYTYNYNIDWGDGTSESGLTGDATHTYPRSDVEYTVKITGTFPAINLSYSISTNRYKINSVVNWGTIEWESMNHAFYSCSNFKTMAEDAPDLSQVTDLSYMFYDAVIDEDFSSWDVSNITNMTYMFQGAHFTKDPGIEDWDVSNVTSMAGMFKSTSFNEDIGSWDVSSVTNLGNMFDSNHSFNQDLSSWDVSSVTIFYAMFYGTSSFSNQDLSSWDVDFSDDLRTDIWYDHFSDNWGSGNIEPNWID